MPDNPPTRRIAARLAPYALTIAGAAALHKASFFIWDWAAPVFDSLCDWTYELLIAWGISSNAAGQIAFYTHSLLLVIMNFLCGAVIGAATRSRWRRFALIFALVLVAMPYTMTPRDLRATVHMYGWGVLLLRLVWIILTIVPSAMLGAWLASRPRKRRLERRRAAGQCEACGYSLIGNTSGACPECGKSTSVPNKTKLADAVV